MITTEDTVDWKDHPVTQHFKQMIEEMIAVEADIDAIDIRQGLETIGSDVVAKVNYVGGLKDAIDFDGFAASVAEESDDE